MIKKKIYLKCVLFVFLGYNLFCIIMCVMKNREIRDRESKREKLFCYGAMEACTLCSSKSNVHFSHQIRLLWCSASYIIIMVKFLNHWFCTFSFFSMDHRFLVKVLRSCLVVGQVERLVDRNRLVPSV